MTAPPVSGGFSLFPNTSNGPRRQASVRQHQARNGGESREGTPAPSQVPHAVTTEGSYATDASASPSIHVSPPRNGNPQRAASPVSHQNGGSFQSPIVQQPRQPSEVPPRADTAFSQANTIVERTESVRSRGSIAKRPFNDDASGNTGEAAPPPGFMSIFPQFNPDLPVNQQDYFPTQRSPTHIPRAVISRPLYSPEPPASPTNFSKQQQQQQQQQNSWETERGGSSSGAGPSSSRARQQSSNHSLLAQHQQQQQQQRQQRRDQLSPEPPAQPSAHWPPRSLQPPKTPTISSQEEIRSLWKVTNGWKASASEGKVYTLKLSQEKDVPVYSLASSSQPFYNLRVDPTSASANITLSRHDPNKPYKAPPAPGAAGSGSSSIVSGSSSGRKEERAGGKGADKHWQEVLATQLEELGRRHQPNDGLVADLVPNSAIKMTCDKPNDEAAHMMAERECARLVWDDDSSSHYLVHPALATPFCVTIERTPAWARVEYTLEHRESPNHLAKLTRDGTGSGYLEVDTGLASKIESFYIVDVAVCALLIVASQDSSFSRVETFEPPPPPQALLAGGSGPGGSPSPHHSSRSQRFSLSSLTNPSSNNNKKERKKKKKMEELEFEDIDVESQDYSFGKPEGKSKQKKKSTSKELRAGLPWPAKIIVMCLTGTAKVVIWCVTIFLKGILHILMAFGRCLGLTSKYR